MLLTDFLRHVLGATGTHVGCEHGVCGACTIEIDGAPARACLTLAVQADGATIRTVEGLAPEPGRLSVLQEAFRRHHALQCGFCTPGILMSLDIYLRDTPSPERSGAARISRRTSVPLHRLRADRRGGARCRGKAAEWCARCLISAPASWPAWRATRTRWRSSTATSASPTRQWYERISALVAGFDELGLEAGDHLVTLLQNRWEAATVHWACQFAGIIVTPINWRATADELDYVLADAEAKALVYEEASAARGGVLQGGAAPSAHRGRRAGRHPVHLAGQRARAGRRAARRRRGLVGDALYVRHHRQAEGRAAPPARRARRGAGPCRAEPLPQRRAHARRDAALPHHGRALAARHVADRRHVRLPAAVRRGAGAGADRSARRSPISIWCRRSITTWCITSASNRRRALGAQARLCRRLDDRRPAQEAVGGSSSRSCSSITTARRRSTPSPSTRTRRRSRARPAAPASTRWCAS